MTWLVTRLVTWLLKRNLPLEARNNLVVHILGSLQALPLSAIIDVNADGELTISGRTLDIGKGMQLQKGADQALRNQALNLIREQVKYESFVGAATKAADANDLLFYRAALWWGQEVERLLKLLAQRGQEPDL